MQALRRQPCQHRPAGREEQQARKGGRQRAWLFLVLVTSSGGMNESRSYFDKLSQVLACRATALAVSPPQSSPSRLHQSPHLLCAQPLD